MKEGDLVNFSKFFSNVGYVTPGLVIEEDRSHRQTVYRVLWGDGKITKEHAGLLRRVEDETG